MIKSLEELEPNQLRFHNDEIPNQVGDDYQIMTMSGLLGCVKKLDMYVTTVR